MNKKYIFLFLLLAIPGLVFVFLKKFGKNEFNVPVYFETGLKSDSICNVSFNGAYHVHDSILQKIDFQKTTVLHVVVVYPFVKDNLSEVMRIKSKYLEDSVEVRVISGVPDYPKADIPITFLDFKDFGNITWCYLRVAEPWSVVVLDKKNQIRGYYDGSRRDEMDRLDLELSILLKKY